MSTQQKIPPLSEVETRELDKQLQLMGGIVNTHELDCRCKDCGVYVDMVDELARRNKKHVGCVLNSLGLVRTTPSSCSQAMVVESTR